MKKIFILLILGMLVFIPAVSAETQSDNNAKTVIDKIMDWLSTLLGSGVKENLIGIKSSASATRDIQIQNLTVGSSTNITVTITNNVSQALSLMESLPSGWNLTRISDDASSFKASTNEWVWFSVGVDVTKTVIYKLTIPSNGSAGIYYINGSISNSSGVIVNVTGENIITVTSEPQPAQSSASANRDIQTQNLTAGSSTNITVTITNNVSQALSLMETLPSGWNLTRISDDADSFRASTNEWVWFSVGAGVTKTVVYRVNVPSNATSGNYYINGCISNSSGAIANVTGENLITVTSESQPAQTSAYAIRDIQIQNLTAGSSTNITVTITNNVSQALSLMESLPAGWNLTRISDDASSFKASTNEWVWFSVGAGVTKTVIYKLTIPSNGSAGIYYINGSISNSSGVIANVTGKNIINIINVLSTPVIVSYAPSSPVNDTAPATRTFIITVNQTVNVTWYFNGAPEQTNSSVTAASYTSTTNLAGAHNVTAVAGNANGTDSKTWIWNVAYPAVAPPMIISSAPSSPVSDTAPATRTFNITVNQTVNATWYFNGVIEQSTTTVTSASYTKTTNLTGRHNVTAIAHNANGTAMQTWEWNVTAPQVVPSTPKPKVPRKPMWH
ncbi:MAG: hypothetical protein L6263_10170, partial [Desulfobacteraceae bacterium]|nr:hypothetical protein [Desulfobacteraceae bacterium]